MSQGPRVLVVRLGSMGDIIHALPAVASLKHSIPRSEITWVVAPKWTALLEGNPYIDRILTLDRRSLRSVRSAFRELRRERFEFAVDFQGLIKSALVAAVARPERIYGFDRRFVRESPAAWFYSSRVRPESVHVVDHNLDLAAAAGATNMLRTFPLPDGQPEGELPAGDFVLASPLAGWGAKQWPLEHYSSLAEALRREFGLTLVVNGARPISAAGTVAHISGLPGLIYATRRAVAVVGLDSGPMHIAAALGKPGVAIYGPTDPERNGPYGGTIRVLRAPGAIRDHSRRPEPDVSMRAITPEQVFELLRSILVGALDGRIS
ncbi:MAG TPA: glycosyltransferase family 9 protein [Bryobacteraceae bacterium]|nr:glycosyltransferase family 9 protein [Bryobacteraceae bacterium]